MHKHENTTSARKDTKRKAEQEDLAANFYANINLPLRIATSLLTQRANVALTQQRMAVHVPRYHAISSVRQEAQTIIACSRRTSLGRLRVYLRRRWQQGRIMTWRLAPSVATTRIRSWAIIVGNSFLRAIGEGSIWSAILLRFICAGRTCSQALLRLGIQRRPHILALLRRLAISVPAWDIGPFTHFAAHVK